MAKKVVIFDFDGTLVDSINFHFEIHREVFEHVGIYLGRRYFFTECNGMEPHEFYEKIIKDSRRKPELIDKVWNGMLKLKKEKGLKSIKTYPGVTNMLKELKKNNLKLLVASSSKRAYVKEILDNNNITKYFDTIIGSDKFKKSKPNPAIFLEAWKNSNADKKECIIIEDSMNGIIAARRSKIDVISLITTMNIEDLPNNVIFAEKHSDIPNLIKNIN